MITIDCKPYNHTIEGKTLAEVQLSPIGFVAFINLSQECDRMARSDQALARLTFRARLKRQAQIVLGDGSKLAMTDEIISALPVKLGLRLNRSLSSANGDEGAAEMLHKGDGVTDPIHIKLGRPIKGADGKEIAELEFQAGSLGAMEDLVVAGNRGDQMRALLAIAKPALGSLSALPDWAIDQITLTDGLFIMTEVLPAFLDEAPSEDSAES